MKRLKKIIKESIDEAFGYHYSRYNNDFSDGFGKPYSSENKFFMNVYGGRDTGDFGSGTYFCSSDAKSEYSKFSKYDGMPSQKTGVISVENQLYRVNFDFYKNLYRCDSDYQARLLYTFCHDLNRFCSIVNKMLTDTEGYYNTNGLRNIYQRIEINANVLNLEIPTYLSLFRLAQSHMQDKNAIQSFSTLIMEKNGFNGVNVSGLYYFDNTMHGSVIYDLSNVSMKPIDQKPIKRSESKSSYFINTIGNTNYIEYKSPQHDLIKSLDATTRDSIISFDADITIDDIPLYKRIIKNTLVYNNCIDTYSLEKLYKIDPQLVKNYLKNLYHRVLNGKVNINKYDNYTFPDLLYKTGSYQFVNLSDRYGDSLFLYKLFHKAKSVEEIDKIAAALKRKMTDDEIEEYNDWKSYLENKEEEY